LFGQSGTMHQSSSGTELLIRGRDCGSPKTAPSAGVTHPIREKASPGRSALPSPQVSWAASRDRPTARYIPVYFCASTGACPHPHSPHLRSRVTATTISGLTVTRQCRSPSAEPPPPPTEAPDDDSPFLSHIRSVPSPRVSIAPTPLQAQ
jgi:hypothetical protein